MITFLVAVVLLVWSVRFHDLKSWGWWLGLIVLAFFLDKILEGLAHLAPRPPRVYGATDSHVVQEAEERLAALRESTRRTIEESEKVGEEARRLTVEAELERERGYADAAKLTMELAKMRLEDRRRRQAEGGGL